MIWSCSFFFFFFAFFTDDTTAANLVFAADQDREGGSIGDYTIDWQYQ